MVHRIEVRALFNPADEANGSLRRLQLIGKAFGPEVKRL
jgi:hypothetical protein